MKWQHQKLIDTLPKPKKTFKERRMKVMSRGYNNPRGQTT
ncbi:hypothetical protein GcM1_149005, partial [Golovinomyces cichoracearum]